MLTHQARSLIHRQRELTYPYPDMTTPIDFLHLTTMAMKVPLALLAGYHLSLIHI